MNRIRSGLAVAAAAAVAAMAFGAGSASAVTTKLCSSSVLPCSVANTYASGSRFTINGEFGLSPLTGCEFTYKFETKAASGSPLPAEITSWTFGPCGGGYTVTPVSIPWTYNISVISPGPNGNGKILAGAKGVAPGFEVNGGTEFGCRYTTVAIPQGINGGSTTFASSVTLPNTSGSGCVSSVSLSMGGFATPQFWLSP